MKNKWIIYSLVAAISASGIAMFGKNAGSIDSILQATILTTVMALTLLTTLFFSGKGELIKTLNIKTLFHILPSGILAACGWLFYVFALTRAPVCHITTVTAIDRFSLGFIAVLAAIFLKDKITLYSAIGLLLFLAGIILMAIK